MGMTKLVGETTTISNGGSAAPIATSLPMSKSGLHRTRRGDLRNPKFIPSVRH